MKSISKYLAILLSLSFLLSSSSIKSQNSKIDSLLEVNKKLKDTDTVKVLNLLKITQECRQKQDIASAIKYAKEAEALFGQRSASREHRQSVKT